jgi:hypothetical protein
MKRLLTIAALSATLLASISLVSFKKWARCQAQFSAYQCPLQAISGSDYCQYHQDWDPKSPKKP